MLRNYRLRFVLLIILLAAMLTTPVWGAPGPFGKSTPPNGATGQPLFPSLSWGDSVGAVGYEYCYDMINDGVCAGDRWIPSGTVALPPNDLANNTTYYWQVRAIDAGPGITLTYANDGVWWSFTTQNPALTVDKALTSQSTTPIALGTVLTYTITATNTGDVTLSNVVVSDTVLTPTGGTTPCATLPEGASCTLVGRYTVTQGDVDAGQIVNTGRAVSNETPVAVTDTVTTPIPQHPALTVDKVLTAQSATPIALGAVLTYTITATNTGNVTLSNGVVSDTVLTPASKNCGILALGATCVLTGSYVVQESDFMAGGIVNRATATAIASNGGPLTPVTDTVTTPLVAAPPVANSDQSLGNPIGQAVTVVVLANDVRGDLPISPTTVMIVNPPPGSTLILGKLLVVPGQGYWTVDPATGAITFIPEASFTGNPMPITYTVSDMRGHTSNAASVTVVYTPRPVANDDASLGNAVGSAVTVNVLANDEAAPGRMLTPASVQIVDADAGSGGKLLTMAGEGVWTVNPNTGAITFTPEVGFGGNPTPISYTVADDQGNTSNPATVTVSYTENPLARNDVSLGNPVGRAVTVTVLANDVAAPDRTLNPASVQITGTVQPGASLVVPGQGVWSVYTTTGAITFTPEPGLQGNPAPITYMVADDQGNVSNPAMVTVTYTAPPVAVDDASLGNPVGHTVTVTVLANDVAAPDRTLNPASVQITGTVQPGASLVVPGQGVWSVYTTTGAITFTPELGLQGNPAPITYMVADDQGNVSNPAIVTVTYTAPPVAVDDASLGNPVGHTVTVTVLANDVAAPDRTLNPASVQITGTVQPGASLVVPGQGVWSVYTTTGAITFTPEASLAGNPTPISYTVADDQGNISNAATVTITYTEPPLANDDVSLDNPIGSTVTVDVLANDSAASGRTLNPAAVQIVGTATPGESLDVAGEGTWSVSLITGAIAFTPEESLAGNPTSITYTVADDQGNISNPAMVTVAYAEIDGGFVVHLPLVVLHWPPIPGVPVLNVINNPNGYGEYTLSWSSTERAMSYLLQESKDSSFSDAVQVYSDTQTSTILSDRGPTRYYYRVQAHNAYGASGWSNVQAVDVLWEKEPNDEAITQANGPLISGLTYYGRFSSGVDKQDYYYLDLQSAQMVELWLSDIAAGQDYDLILRNAALQIVGYSGELGNAIEHIRTITLPAGLYYIQVYNRSGSGSTQAYSLRVAYPAMGLTSAVGRP